jgi:hypothetical protein
MKKLIIATALAALIGSPALAQSYDPSIGSGNIASPPNAVPAPWAAYRNNNGAYARDTRSTRSTRSTRGPVTRGPFASGATPQRDIWNGYPVRIDPDPNIQFQLNRMPPGSQW